jgi:oligopeptide/dipeptide ABC transporter ATP-binding protein
VLERRRGGAHERAVTTVLTGAPLLRVRDLKVHFPIRRGLLRRKAGAVRAVDGIDFDIAKGETLGLVGESGCGKTTTGRAVMRLIEPTAGAVEFEGENLLGLSADRLRARRRHMQMVFQDPYSSLNPRHRTRDIVRAPLDIFAVGTAVERRARVEQLLGRVGLRADQAANFPHQFSGGQRQRVGIARALALEPSLIICDEPVSALDLSVQAQILNLLKKLQQDIGLSYLFISHDLGVVEHISHRIAVMYRGRIVETGPKALIFAQPRHPYTELLLASAPVPHPRQRRAAVADKEIADGPADGCAFAARCPLAKDRCRVEAPALTPRPDGRTLACHER